MGKPGLRSLFLLLISTLSTHIYALEIDELLDSDQLKIESWLSTKENKGSPVAINEQVVLYVDIATNRWFTRGTDFGHIEVQNLVIPPRSTQATNYTERESSETWSHQRWEIRLFPQATGEYLVPSIPVNIQVSTTEGNVAGVIYTQPQRFKASLPDPSISANTIWFTSSSASVTQDISLSSDNPEAGDVIERTIEIKANDSVSMLLPNAIKPVSIENVKAYSAPYELSDASNRGTYTSTRMDRTTYLLQSGGDISLPDIEVYWWDTENNKLNKVILEGGTYKVSHTFSSYMKANWKWITSLVALVILTLFGVIRLKTYYRNRPKPESYLFSRALRNKEWGLARTLIYRRLRVNYNLLTLGELQDSEKWQKKAQLVQGEGINSSLARRTWKALGKKHFRRFTVPKALPSLEYIRQKNSPEK